MLEKECVFELLLRSELRTFRSAALASLSRLATTKCRGSVAEYLRGFVDFIVSGTSALTSSNVHRCKRCKIGRVWVSCLAELMGRGVDIQSLPWASLGYTTTAALTSECIGSLVCHAIARSVQRRLGTPVRGRCV